MAKNVKLLEELVIKVNSRALKQAVTQQDQLGDRMEDAAAGTELLNEQLVNTNAALTEARKLSRGLANTLETIGTGANMSDYFDGVVAAIQDVEGTISELSAAFEDYTSIARRGNDEVVLTLERLLDPLRKVDQQTKKTADSTERLKDGLRGAGDQQARTSKGTEGAQRSTKGATRSFQDLAKVAGPLPMIYATIAANVYALTEAYNQLAAGDRLNRLEQINKAIGQEQGVALSNLASIMQEATGYAVSFEGAMLKASQASAYGFSPDQVEQFTLAARRASVALGVDLDDAMNRVIRGVSKLEIELLDELGITVRLNEAYDKYAKQLGIQATSLSGYQKQQAYANAVIEESTKRFGYLDKQMQATEWEKFAQNIDQAVKSGQKWISEVQRPLAEGVNQMMDPSKVEMLTERLNTLAEVQSEQQKEGKMLQLYKLQSESKELTQSKDLYAQKKEELKQQKEIYNSEETSLLQKLKAQQAINILDAEMRELNIAIAAQAGNYAQLVQSQTKYTLGSAQAAQAQQRAKSQFDASTQSIKEAGEVMKGFDLENKFTQLAIEKPLGQLRSALDAAKLLEESKKDYSAESSSMKQITEQMEKVFKEVGVTSMEELVAKEKAFQDYASFASTSLRESDLSAQKMQKNLQFGQGETQALQENARQAKLVQDELQKATVVNSSGETVNLIPQQKILELKQQQLKLDAERNTLQAAHNEALAQQKQIIADTQYQEAVLNNQDPLKQKLKLLEQQISQQQALNQQNRGISKPEDQAQQENQLVDLMSQRRDILRAIQDRETQIAEAKQESSRLDTILLQTSIDRQQDTRQELGLLRETEVILRDKLKKAKEFGETEEATLQIQNEIKANIIAQQQAQQKLLKSKFESLEAEVQLRGREMGLTELDVLQQQVQTKKEFIQALQQEKASRAEIYEQQVQLRELEVQQQNAKQAESVKYRNLGMDALGSQGSVPLVQGPTQIGDQQLKEQELQTAMDAINRSFSELSSYNPAFSDMIANVSNLGLAFHQMGEGAQTGQQVAAQGMSTVASMLNMVAQETISSIDQQISAEKERDGKSEESKKKIQKLEAEKAAQQKKAQTEQIVMQTAMGITQALATLPPPVSYAMAATTQLMGQQALKSQQSGSAIASVGEASVPSLSLGERDNRIDVSRSASAGELQYIQGGNGVGNASDFKPRAVGNRAPANHQVMVGENGPEVVAFDTPGTITAQNQVSQGSSKSSGNTYVIQAMDSESFQSFLQKNGDILSGAVEYNLNNTGYTLFNK